jgi:hypothetical protein
MDEEPSQPQRVTVDGAVTFGCAPGMTVNIVPMWEDGSRPWADRPYVAWDEPDDEGDGDVMAGPATGNPGMDRETKPAEGAPYGWIQWKGTDVCMDFWCSCGHQGHIDRDFTYFIRCDGCGQVYAANGHIEMVPLTAAETATLNGDSRIVPSGN